MARRSKPPAFVPGPGQSDMTMVEAYMIVLGLVQQAESARGSALHGREIEAVRLVRAAAQSRGAIKFSDAYEAHEARYEQRRKTARIEEIDL